MCAKSRDFFTRLAPQKRPAHPNLIANRSDFSVVAKAPSNRLHSPDCSTNSRSDATLQLGSARKRLGIFLVFLRRKKGEGGGGRSQGSLRAVSPGRVFRSASIIIVRRFGLLCWDLDSVIVMPQ